MVHLGQNNNTAPTRYLRHATLARVMRGVTLCTACCISRLLITNECKFLTLTAPKKVGTPFELLKASAVTIVNKNGKAFPQNPTMILFSMYADFFSPPAAVTTTDVATTVAAAAAAVAATTVVAAAVHLLLRAGAFP